jgi:hypothetical protein
VKRRLFEDDDEDVTSVGLDFQGIYIHKDDEEPGEGVEKLDVLSKKFRIR